MILFNIVLRFGDRAPEDLFDIYVLEVIYIYIIVIIINVH